VRIRAPAHHVEHAEQAERLGQPEAPVRLRRRGHQDGQQQGAERQDQCDFRQTDRTLLVPGQPHRGGGDRGQHLQDAERAVAQAAEHIDGAEHGHHQERGELPQVHQHVPVPLPQHRDPA
jgi:hypothetical protein